MYTGPSSNPYRNNQPPKHILLKILEQRGHTHHYEVLKRYLERFGY